MVWAFECPVDDCGFSTSGNEQAALVEDAQQHIGDKHGDTPTRDEVVPHVIGPG